MTADSSLTKALRLLLAVGESPNPAGATVTELVSATKLSRPTTYRFLSELEGFGLIRAAGKRGTWLIGPRILGMAARSGDWSVLRRRARELMEDFVRNEGYGVFLGIRDGGDVVYVDRAESASRLTPMSTLGQRRAVNVTALGKALVAFDANPGLAEQIAEDGLVGRTAHSITVRDRWLEEIRNVRRQGYALDNSECDLGARCVAAPILDIQGHAVAAVSVSVLTGADDQLDLSPLIFKIRGLAAEIGVSGPL